MKHHTHIQMHALLLAAIGCRTCVECKEAEARRRASEREGRIMYVSQNVCVRVGERERD
eukprot:c18787_g1_i1 orf=3-176(-)